MTLHAQYRKQWLPRLRSEASPNATASQKSRYNAAFLLLENLMWICPICQQPLSPVPHGLACAARHQFDRAREGYVNLLPVQQKKSKNPGDNPAMIDARRRFLHAGHYQPLATTISQLLPIHGKDVLLDIGCGEGYYSQFILQQHPELQLIGIDISKAAIKAAAKQCSAQQWAVASAYQLPLPDGVVDAVLRVYAPSLDSELCRVLKPAGHVVTVTPAPEHLLQFKQRVYTEVRLHTDTIATIAGLVHQQRQRLSWLWQAGSASDLLALLDMIPLAYKFDDNARRALADDLPAIQLDFYVDVYQKPLTATI